jgi:4-hydroxybenzoate polyprenyltransferase
VADGRRLLAALGARARATLDLVKFAHTVFALPFALLAAFLAAGGVPRPRTLALLLLAMVAARTGAMAMNRLADRRYDADNPRTRGRALATGALGAGYVAGLCVASFAVLVLAAWALNPLALKLSPVAVAVLCLYSYTKRFTWLSHLALGLALAGAPLGAWIAVTGAVAWTPVVLGLAVGLWVAGFDVIYACQDVEFDRRAGLHSIPARFGVARALRVSTALHAAMVAVLLTVPLLSSAGAFFTAGVLVVGALLLYEHRLVGPRSLERVDEAFFTANGLVSVVLFLFGALDVVLFGGA